ncbi:helix-turn-helix domain-containing protein [Micromonospora sp. NPDC048170]|uniref:helix-turn-helix domain-containing protein n=1 Tax=Micromonospora sp. NPDC048170 TaxID=3154819 RepID=UPI003400CF58
MSTVIPFPPRPTPTDADTIPTIRTAPVARAVYTVAETAEILSLSLGSTYALVRSGEIPAKKVGGRWLVPKGRLHQWLNELPEASTEDVAAELERIERAEQRQQRRNGA